MLSKSAQFNLFLYLGITVPVAAVFLLLVNSLRVERNYAETHYGALVQRELDSVVNAYSAQWQKTLDEINEYSSSVPVCAFTHAVVRHQADAATIKYTLEQAYPTSNFLSVSIATNSAELLRANRLEFRDNNYTEAKDVYESILFGAEIDARFRAKAGLGLVRLYTNNGVELSARVLTSLESMMRSEHSEVQSTTLSAFIALLNVDEKNQTLRNLVSSYLLAEQCNQGHSLSKGALLAKLPLSMFEQNTSLNRLRAAEKLSIKLMSSSDSASQALVSEKSLVEISSSKKNITLYLNLETLLGNLRDQSTDTFSFDIASLEVIPSKPEPSTYKFATQFPGVLSGYWLAINPKRDDGGRSFWSGAKRFIILGCAIVFLFSSVVLLIARIKKREQISTLKSSLLSTVSHEMKTPLTSVSALTENLLDESLEQDRSSVMEYIRNIQRENQRLQRLVENFLSYAKHDNAININTYSVGLKSLIDDVVTRMEIRYPRRSKDISINVVPNSRSDSDEISYIQADTELARVVLANILDNALKYSDGMVSLIAETRGKHIVISVSDTGEGIPSASIKSVFQQFYRVDNRLSRTTEGCGLGLYISKNIMRSLSGLITIESEVGRGTRVELVFLAGKPEQDTDA